MGVIYKEHIHYKKPSAARWFLLVLFFMLAANLLSNGFYYSEHYRIQIWIPVALGGFIALVALSQAYDMLYLHRISYEYMLIDRELIFERVANGRRRAVLSIDLKHVDSLDLAGEEGACGDMDKTYKFLCCPMRDSRVYCCIANQRGKRIRAYFEPSGALVAKLKMLTGGGLGVRGRLVS